MAANNNSHLHQEQIAKCNEPHQKTFSAEFGNGVIMANGRFMITKSIGKGSFGEIFQGLDTHTSKEVAIKMVM
jgi:serine/threonine protein kinase